MRSLYTAAQPVLPADLQGRSYARRRFSSVSNTLTCLVLFKHGESETELQVSDDGDAVGAVWIPKTPVMLDAKDRGAFLVVTLTHTMANRFGLRVCLLDWDRYTPAERAMLKDAVETAKRARDRLSGHPQSSMGYMGRNAFA